MFYLTRMCLRKLCHADPSAYAIIRGSEEFPEIQGMVYIYDMPEGCVLMAEVVGLPDQESESRMPVQNRDMTNRGAEQLSGQMGRETRSNLPSRMGGGPAEIPGLRPPGNASPMLCQMSGSHFFGFHIHEGNRCGRTTPDADAFSAAGGHFNPWNCPHPYHAGDLPPLLSSNGYAWLSVYTERFSSMDVLGRTVIIHDMPDDFTSQPAGNSGKRIACGRIMA